MKHIGYRFMRHGRQATLVSRDGTRHQVRESWIAREALDGHAQSAHDGRVILSCPACRELKSQVRLESHVGRGE